MWTWMWDNPHGCVRHDSHCHPSISYFIADVIAERSRVQAMTPATQDMITLSGLRKVYPSPMGGAPKIAVHDLWLGIPEGECFGYLGINVSMEHVVYI